MTGVVVPRGSTYLNTESGLSAPGGFLDRLTQAVDISAQYQGVMAGLGPALRQSGVPVSTPPGIFSSLFQKLGLGSTNTSAPPAMPVAGASPTMTTAGQGAPVFGPNQGGAAAPSTPQPAQAMAYASAGAGMPSGDGLIPAIAQIAQKNGIDPMTAIRAVHAESGGNPGAIGDGGSSFGLLQLHYGGMAPGGNSGAGMGDDFTAQTGLDARDPRNALAALDYALGRVAKEGWGAFHGAAKAGIGQWQGIGGGQGGQAPAMPSQATAYAPNGGDGGNTMPQARADGPQPPQAAVLASSNTPGAAGQPDGGGQMASASQGGTSASPAAVIMPLMQNPATRQIGGQLWQSAVQQGGGSGMSGSMTLPAGMTPEALATMISTPQTMQMGLAIWQKAMYPQITSVEPGRAIFRGTQYMGQAPSAPMDVGPGHAVVNPNTGATVAAVPPDLQRGEVGRDAYGQPTYGAFNPRSGAVTPFAATPGTTAGTATGPDGQPLSGDAFLGTLPPAIAGQVKAIADGRVKLPSGMGSTSPMAQRLRAAVLQYDPSFDQAGVDARFETRADFAKGDAAKTITAGNTALIHLGELSDLADKLGNADTSWPGNNAWNAAKNYANSSSAAGAPLAAFNATASKYVEEATKFYRGTGGTEGDISRDMLNLSPNMSPTQIKAAIGAQLPLIAGKVAAMQDRWRQGMGPKAGDYPILAPQAQAVLGRLGPQAQPATAPASSSLPVAAPAGSGAQAPAPSAGGATKTIRGVTYTRGPDGHWYTGQ